MIRTYDKNKIILLINNQEIGTADQILIKESTVHFLGVKVCKELSLQDIIDVKIYTQRYEWLGRNGPDRPIEEAKILSSYKGAQHISYGKYVQVKDYFYYEDIMTTTFSKSEV